MDLGGKVPPFRGRCRVGRGGRIIIDRRSRPRVTSGIVPYWETDVESNSRFHFKSFCLIFSDWIPC